MKTTTVLSAVAALAATAAAAELKIDVTHKVECERKTQKGDKVSMHYRGTLAADGSQFDASASSLLSRPPRGRRLLEATLGLCSIDECCANSTLSNSQATTAALPSTSKSALGRSSRGKFHYESASADSLAEN